MPDVNVFKLKIDFVSEMVKNLNFKSKSLILGQNVILGQS
jgi:hypothetical protein